MPPSTAEAPATVPNLTKIFPDKLPTSLGVEMEFSYPTAPYANATRPAPEIPTWSELFEQRNTTIGENHPYFKGWHLKSEHCGMEFVFHKPAADSADAAARIDAVSNWARLVGAKTSDAGTHIHLGVKGAQGTHADQTKENVEFVSWLLYYESVIMCLVPLRRAVGYNPPWLFSSVAQLGKRHAPEYVENGVIFVPSNKEAMNRVIARARPGSDTRVFRPGGPGNAIFTLPEGYSALAGSPIAISAKEGAWIVDHDASDKKPRPREAALQSLTARINYSAGTLYAMPVPIDKDGLSAYARGIMGNHGRSWFCWAGRHPTIEIRLLEGTISGSRVKAWVALWQLIMKRHLAGELTVPDAVTEVFGAKMPLDDQFEQFIQAVRPPLRLRRWLRETYEICKDPKFTDFTNP